MNFIGLVRETWVESGRSGAGPGSVTQISGDALRITACVRDAWLAIQAMPRNWRWMRRTAAVALPAQMSHATTAFDATRLSHFVDESEEYRPTAYLASNPANEWPLRQLDWERFRSMFVVGQHQPGPPQLWSVDDQGQLRIGPTPNQGYTYRFDYVVTPQVLAADTDTPEMPAQFHPAIKWRAVMQRSLQDNDASTYDRARVHYEEIESALISRQGERIGVRWRSL